MITRNFENWSSALGPLRSSMDGGKFGGSDNRLERRVLDAVRALLEGKPGLFEDDCIVHARDGDDALFDDWKDFIDSLKGYVIIPIEEYTKLGGNDR
jgi:hypothetical protein